MTIDRATIDEIRRRADLVELVRAGGVDLQRRGRDWVGLCPFHSEQSPSFTVSDRNGEGQRFKCFGCQAAGDAIDFIERVDGVAFPEAARRLADRLGLALPDATPEERAVAAAARRRQDDLETTYREAHERLLSPAGAAARAYLAGRGVGEGIIAEFGLGLGGPDTLGWRRPCGRAPLDGYIIVPWRDATGHPATLIGRRGPDIPPGPCFKACDGCMFRSGAPKLLYQPGAKLTSPLFLDRARRLDSERLILVEGPFDAIAGLAAGTPTAALGGAALTVEQLVSLQGAKRAIVALDPDGAGGDGTRKILGQLARAAIDGYAVQGLDHDPDEWIREHGAEAWRDILEQAPSGARWLAARILAGITRESPDGARKAALGGARGMVADLGLAGPDLEEVVRDVCTATGFSRAVVRRALRVKGKRKQAEGALPTIDLREQLRDVQGEAIEALAALRPRAYAWGDAPVGVTRAGAARVLTRGAVLERLALAADWTRDGVPCSPPAELTPALLEGARWLAALPPLRLIARAPVFAPDGRLLTESGYDKASGVLVRLPGQPPKVPEKPTHGEVIEARHLLEQELLGDFPFVEPADRAAALAILIVPAIRLLIDGPTPVHLVEAPCAGTGKGLAVEVMLRVALGDPPPVQVLGRDEEAVRKGLTATLMSVPRCIWIDNARERVLDLPSLAAIVTAPTWTDRILGVSRNVTVPVTCSWVATGNNLRLTTELARRCVPCRIEAAAERPWERDPTTFRHPDLRAWARVRHEDLQRAVLTLGAAWIAAGRPRGTVPLGSFEAYSEALGGLFEVIGVPGWLDNLHRFYRRADITGEEWAPFVAAWWDQHGTYPASTGELRDLADERSMLGSVLGDKGTRSQQVRLGSALARMEGRTYDGRTIARVPNTSTKSNAWRLVQGEGGAV